MNSMLFSPYTLRSVTFPNRVMIAPMCQYSAQDGLANDWHFAHLSKFAIGRAGGIMTEAAAVTEDGRITHGDLGIWSDAQATALARIIQFITSQGSIPGIQLGHAGRKGSRQRPWFGDGPLTAEDHARGDLPWPIQSPTNTPHQEGWLEPSAMSEAEIERVIAAFGAAAARSHKAGFQFAEIHGAHGYLLHTFLSPLTNTRKDQWGGSFDNRIRMACAVAASVRAHWPEDKPLFFRISSLDGVEGGWNMDDSVALARRLAALGVDIIDCSSGGIHAKGAIPHGPGRGPGFQVPFAARIKSETELASMAVGLILDGPQAEEILHRREADLIAIGREALVDPFWALHAANALEGPQFELWPEQYGWWLERRNIGHKNS